MGRKGKADPRLDLIEVAMHGGKMGFEKIIKMIDNLVIELKAEQGIDDDKKSYCEAELDKSGDKLKGLKQTCQTLRKPSLMVRRASPHSSLRSKRSLMLWRPLTNPWPRPLRHVRRNTMITWRRWQPTMRP